MAVATRPTTTACHLGAAFLMVVMADVMVVFLVAATVFFLVLAWVPLLSGGSNSACSESIGVAALD